MSRARMSLQMTEQLDLAGRTGEMVRQAPPHGPVGLHRCREVSRVVLAVHFTMDVCASLSRNVLGCHDRMQISKPGTPLPQARAFGIDFFSVLARGSQYRVESMMCRLAHSQNYLLLAASKEQVSLSAEGCHRSGP